MAALIYEAVWEPGQVCKSWTIRRRAPALSPVRLSGSRPAVPLHAGSAPWRPHCADEDTGPGCRWPAPGLWTLATEVAVPRVLVLILVASSSGSKAHFDILVTLAKGQGMSAREGDRKGGGHPEWPPLHRKTNKEEGSWPSDQIPGNPSAVEPGVFMP